MQDYKVFTIDQSNFGDLGGFVTNLTAKMMHWIPIIDPGVAQRLPSIEKYQPYTDGLEQGVFIRANADNQDPITGSVWADDAVFPDWAHPSTPAYWSKWLSALRAEAAFDGLWLDMNEASNMLCTGTCYDDQKSASPSQWRLPYIPTGRNLEAKGLSLDATHSDGFTELDYHSLFGALETKTTHDFFVNTLKQRPMIIERSAFAGTGQYGSRWLGDNFSTAEYMGYSVTGIMAHSVAGIALAGADICGFIGDTNAELCARWYVVGAFYPFSRNHNSWDTIAQEPWNFNTVYERSITYLDIIRNAMVTKLHLIRYYYTQLSKVQTDGGAFYKPLFFEFPDEAGAYADQELNVMLGSGVKLGVQSTGTGIDTTNFFFPAGLWCEIINRKGVDGCFT
jgi:alpha-glucosidase (family GH31 glycosyl hydrolase)